jgi:hypothetical protein
MDRTYNLWLNVEHGEIVSTKYGLDNGTPPDSEHVLRYFGEHREAVRTGAGREHYYDGETVVAKAPVDFGVDRTTAAPGEIINVTVNGPTVPVQVLINTQEITVDPGEVFEVTAPEDAKVKLTLIEPFMIANPIVLDFING